MCVFLSFSDESDLDFGEVNTLELAQQQSNGAGMSHFQFSPLQSNPNHYNPIPIQSNIVVSFPLQTTKTRQSLSRHARSTFFLCSRKNNSISNLCMYVLCSAAYPVCGVWIPFVFPSSCFPVFLVYGSDLTNCFCCFIFVSLLRLCGVVIAGIEQTVLGRDCCILHCEHSSSF